MRITDKAPEWLLRVRHGQTNWLQNHHEFTESQNRTMELARGSQALILQAEKLRNRTLGQDMVGTHKWRQSHPKTQASVSPHSHCRALKVSIATWTAEQFRNVLTSSVSSVGRICKLVDQKAFETGVSRGK